MAMVPSTFFTVKRTSVPFGPLISFMASSSRIPPMSTGSSVACATFNISSPISRSLPRQTGPPEMISTILMA